MLMHRSTLHRKGAQTGGDGNWLEDAIQRRLNNGGEVEKDRKDAMVTSENFSHH